MITDARGDIYICGFENRIPGIKNGCIIKYDSNGNFLWNISYDAGLNLDDKFNSITLDKHEDILVTGQTYTSSTNSNYVTVKYGMSVTGVKEFSTTDGFNIYPVPAQSSATLSFNSSETTNMSILIYDTFGKEVENILSDNLPKGDNKINLDLSELNNGLYYVHMTNSKRSMVAKFLVEK